MGIYIVIVLYKMHIAAAPSVLALKRALKQLTSEEAERFSVLLYDNSPVSQADVSINHWRYRHDAENAGLAKAYNFAWQAAVAENRHWLLLLDQDTEITIDYLKKLLAEVEAAASMPELVALAPVAMDGQQQLSPVSSETVAPLRQPLPRIGSYQSGVMCINSGLCLQVAFLDEIRGFEPTFPLDYLDHWLCQQIFKHGYTLKILPVHLQHQLSVFNIHAISLERYQSILTAEKRYYCNHRPDLLPAYRKQLWKRLFKQVLQMGNKRIIQLTWQEIQSYRSF